MHINIDLLSTYDLTLVFGYALFMLWQTTTFGSNSNLTWFLVMLWSHQHLISTFSMFWSFMWHSHRIFVLNHEIMPVTHLRLKLRISLLSFLSLGNQVSIMLSVWTSSFLACLYNLRIRYQSGNSMYLGNTHMNMILLIFPRLMLFSHMLVEVSKQWLLTHHSTRSIKDSMVPKLSHFLRMTTKAE